MTPKSETIEVIKWGEFQQGIAPLWNESTPSNIPIFNNPYCIIQYPQHMWHTDIIYFPAKYTVDNNVVGYISIYNLSDTHIRPRGIYIKPEFRGYGLGHRMQKAAWDLFPDSFYRAFIWSREENLDRFTKYSHMKEVPGVGPVWSEFSQKYQYFMYYDRSTRPAFNIEISRDFIRTNSKKYSLGGTNNMNVDWDILQWDEYFECHKGNYNNLQIDLDF